MKSNSFTDKAFKYVMRWRGRVRTIGELGGSFSIINYKAYQYYINNSKLANREDISDYVEHGKIISEFYRIAGEKIVEASGGLFIENFGYFGIIQEMKKKPAMDRRTGNLFLNPKTDNIIYNIAFVPIDKTNIFRPWVFDYAFIKPIKKALCKQLKSGMIYSFNASLFFNKLRKTGNDI
jgi:hypothetical protein